MSFADDMGWLIALSVIAALVGWILLRDERVAIALLKRGSMLVTLSVAMLFVPVWRVIGDSWAYCGSLVIKTDHRPQEQACRMYNAYDVPAILVIAYGGIGLAAIGWGLHVRQSGAGTAGAPSKEPSERNANN